MSVAGGFACESGFGVVGRGKLSCAAVVAASEAFAGGDTGFRGVSGFAPDALSFTLIAGETPAELFVAPKESTCGFGVVAELAPN